MRRRALGLGLAVHVAVRLRLPRDVIFEILVRWIPIEEDPADEPQEVPVGVVLLEAFELVAFQDLRRANQS